MTNLYLADCSLLIENESYSFCEFFDTFEFSSAETLQIISDLLAIKQTQVKITDRVVTLKLTSLATIENDDFDTIENFDAENASIVVNQH